MIGEGAVSRYDIKRFGVNCRLPCLTISLARSDFGKGGLQLGNLAQIVLSNQDTK
jgi:hypothetical protein